MFTCSCGKWSENQLEGGECATCKHLKRKAARMIAKPKKVKNPLAKVSGKMHKALGEYSRIKAAWIKGKRCAVYPRYEATDVHHMKGRVGFADQWARENEIPLLIDTRFWLPVSRPGHNEIETKTAWAREKGYSLPRSEIIS